MTGIATEEWEKKSTDFDTQISSANDVLDLARNKHRFELRWQIGSPMGDMKIP